jgi:hypothetical protein
MKPPRPRPTTRSVTPTPIPAAAPGERPEEDAGSVVDDPTNEEAVAAEAPVPCATPKVVELDSVLGSTLVAFCGVSPSSIVEDCEGRVDADDILVTLLKLDDVLDDEKSERSTVIPTVAHRSVAYLKLA